jgi:hypothetical protein
MIGRAHVMVGLVLAAALSARADSFTQERKPMTTRHATGTFTVTMQPPADTGSPGTFIRLRLDKTFEGGLAGASEVEMLASNGGDQPAGGYVALERFTGTLDGRRGSFIMQHSGTMSPGAMQIDVQVTPGSGTDALKDLQGRLTIRREGTQHFYDLAYSLP